MSRSKNWKAVVADNIALGLQLTVTGEINTGDNKSKATLEPKKLQGFNPNVLILEASPISKGGTENFQPVEHKEKLKEGRQQYSSVQILEKDTEEALVTITEIIQDPGIA